MTDDEIRKAIREGFEYSYLHDDWVTPLSEALDDVSASQALAKPNGAEKGIWDMVLHVARWNENIVQRIETGAVAKSDEPAWPLPPGSPDEAGWAAAKQRLFASLDEVGHMIDTVPIEKISQSTYGLGDLLCRFTHCAYHIGQITKLREALGLPTRLDSA